MVIRDMGAAADASAARGQQKTELFKLLLAALILIISLYFSIVLGTEYLVSRLSPAQEKNWFGHFSSLNIHSALANTESGKKWASILDKLVAQQRAAETDKKDQLDYQIVIMDKQQINAFAFPGGTIGITQPMVDKVDNERAMAFVIAHEIGHFHYRHHLKAYARQIGLGISLSLLFGDDNGSGLSQSLVQLLEYKHSRDEEAKADQFAAKLVFATYGSLQDVDQLFYLLESQDKSTQGPAFLRSHPGNKERILAIDKMSRELD